jgi:hypothetical protein
VPVIRHTAYFFKLDEAEVALRVAEMLLSTHGAVQYPPTSGAAS